MNIVEVVNVRWWNASAYYAVLQAYGLQKRGHRVIIAGKKDSLPLKKAQEWGLEVYDEINLESTRPEIAVQILKKFPTFLKKNHIDILNPHRGENFPLLAIVAKKQGIPVIRNRGDARPPRKNIFSKYQNLQLTDFHIVSLTKMIPYYKELGIPTNKIKTLYGAVHPDFEIQRITPNFSKKELTFGMLARLAPIKGHEIALKAFQKLVKIYPDAKFIIAGKEERLKYQDLKSIINELKLQNNVQLMGYVDNIFDFFRMIDVGISASYDSEVICRICFEMMSQGIPMIVSDWNVLNEIIQDGYNGLVFQKKNIDDLFSKMKYIYENREELFRISKNARKEMENKYFLDKFIDQVEEIFTKILDEKR